MSEPILVERLDGIAVVTLNLPEKRNALGESLYRPLSHTLRELQDERDLRALVLYGGQHFCSGGDISALQSPGLDMRHAMQVGHDAVRALVGGRLVSIAAVAGNAFGAGFSLAIACDFVVADPSAVFCAAFGRVGLTPDYGLAWTLPQRVSMGLAKEILMLGEPIDARQAKEWRLVDRLAEPGRALADARALAGKIAKVPSGTLETTKSALSRGPLSLEQLLSWEADTQALLATSDEVRERVKAFLEQRTKRAGPATPT
jgi:enoyl-CoA hydratase/carnithine racemase